MNKNFLIVEENGHVLGYITGFLSFALAWRDSNRPDCFVAQLIDDPPPGFAILAIEPKKD